MRQEKSGVRYFGLAELAEAYGVSRTRTKDQAKIKKQQEKFVSKHLCRACKQPMIWVPGSNTMVCGNEKCKGIEVTRDDGTKYYLTSYDLLDDVGEIIAERIFE